MQLRPEQRQVLEMGLLQGLTHSEIAEALHMPLGTVKTMMRRGLIQVRQFMGTISAEVAKRGRRRTGTAAETDPDEVQS
jgi:DNA-directed RNA polymerase specialized sigma24 family protein